MIEDDFAKSLTLHQRERFIKYIERLRIEKLESLAVAPDEITVRRAQGAVATYKDLVRRFTV